MIPRMPDASRTTIPATASPSYSPGRWRPDLRVERRTQSLMQSRRRKRRRREARGEERGAAWRWLRRAVSFSIRLNSRKVFRWVIRRTRTYCIIGTRWAGPQTTPNSRRRCLVWIFPRLPWRRTRRRPINRNCDALYNYCLYLAYNCSLCTFMDSNVILLFFGLAEVVINTFAVIFLNAK